MPDNVYIKEGIFKGYYPTENIKALIRASMKHGLNPNTVLAVALQESNFGTTRDDYGVNNISEFEEQRLKISQKLLNTNKLLSKYDERGGDLMGRKYYQRVYDETESADTEETRSKGRVILDGLSKYPPNLVKQKWDLTEELDKSYTDEEVYRKETPPEDILVKTLVDKINYAKKLGYENESHQLQAFNGLGVLDTGEMGMYNRVGKIDTRKEPIYGNRIIDLRENTIKKNPTIQKLILEHRL